MREEEGIGAWGPNLRRNGNITWDPTLVDQDQGPQASSAIQAAATATSERPGRTSEEWGWIKEIYGDSMNHLVARTRNHLEKS